MRFLLALPLILAAAPVLAEPPAPAMPMRTTMRASPEGQPLYFAVELRRDGQVVGTPKLLGADGKRLTVEKRQPGAATFDYRLVLFPNHGTGDRYELALDVAVPGLCQHYEIQMEHGQIQKLAPATKPGDAKGADKATKGLEVELTLLKVDSPEFRALMKLTTPASEIDPVRKSI